MPTLTWQRTTEKSQVFRVTAPEISIGRDAANTVRVDSTFVSRQHAVIRETRGVFTITDLGSANGTYVNGVRVQTAPLSAGDTITLGSEALAFSVAGARPAWVTIAVAGLGGLMIVLLAALLLAPTPEQAADDPAAAAEPATGAQPAGPAAAPVDGVAVAPLLPEPTIPPAPDPPMTIQVPPDGPAPPSPDVPSGARVDSSALYDAALAHIKGDRLLEARQLLVEAIQVGPENPSARQRLLEVDATIQARIEQHLAAGQQQVSYLRFREAILEWEQVLALTPSTDERHQQALDAIERARLRLGGR